MVTLSTITGGLTLTQPEVPADYLEETKEAWEHYWDSGLVEAIINVDVHVVKVYFRLYDRWLRVMAVAEETPFAEGSTGQVTNHPAVSQSHMLLKDLNDLGQQLGITPAARQRLRITTGKAVLTAAEVNKMVQDQGKPAGKPGKKVIDGQWEAVD